MGRAQEGRRWGVGRREGTFYRMESQLRLHLMKTDTFIYAWKESFQVYEKNGSGFQHTSNAVLRLDLPENSMIELLSRHV